jgi:hypothetical protein
MNKIKIILLTFSVFLLFSCSHSIKIKSAYFATPITSEKQWSGSVGISVSKPSVITLVDDPSTNPPIRNGVRINDASDPNAVTFVDFYTDIRLSVFKSWEVFFSDRIIGAKWQILNHNTKEDWVASLIGGYGVQNTENSSSTHRYKTELTTTRAGASVGYQMARGLLPYASYLYHNHHADTIIDNSFGAFGSYIDKGVHHNAALGLTTTGRGFNFAIEYNLISMIWNDTSKGSEGLLGMMLNYEW